MSASEDEWLDGMEELLMEDGNTDTVLYFVSSEVPDYMFEHWQNCYEAEDQDYFVDVENYVGDDSLW